ncbi:hypothetical protein CH262_06130 [Rhodococcus sp. 05-2255-1e]|uniref:hypothetical protein n=1 Tax=Nocardiaceae TaxID=85025 RepID=UPI00050C10EE|nr:MULTISPECIES: hypothetical protein [Rhodococcus]OZE27562.1 hypothetical protein CH262_06130 [Rhodococcus sp. 05-2255-1e]
MKHNTFVACTAAFAGIAVVLLLGAGSTPAQTVKYSADGERWDTDFVSPLFGRDIRWVPQDSRSSQFHVFNDSDTDGRLWVSLASDNPAFARALDVSIGDTVTGSCALTIVAAGEKKRIDVVVAMSEAAGNDTRTSTARIDLVLQWDHSMSDVCPELSGARMDMEGAQS